MCALFHITLAQQLRDNVVSQPMCVGCLLHLLRAEDEAAQELAAGTLHNLSLSPTPRHVIMKDDSAVETIISTWAAQRLVYLLTFYETRMI